MTSDVKTLPASTHCTTNVQASVAARNNIGQLMSTLHYSELKLLNSGDIQPNSGPVSSESNDTYLYWPVLSNGAQDG